MTELAAARRRLRRNASHELVDLAPFERTVCHPINLSPAVVTFLACHSQVVGVIRSTISAALQVLDRGSVMPLLVTPAIRENDMPVAIAAFSILPCEEREQIASL